MVTLYCKTFYTTKFYIAQDDVDTGPSSKCPRKDVIDQVEGSLHTDSAFIDGE